MNLCCNPTPAVGQYTCHLQFLQSVQLMTLYLLIFLLLESAYTGVRFFSGEEGVQLGFLVQIGEEDISSFPRTYSGDEIK